MVAAEDRFDRQVRAFGRDGQASIEAQHVGIVGLGGLGSHVAQALAYLGVRQYTLVDPDRVSETNLNRLIGATPADAQAAVHKVAVLARLISAVRPEAGVTSIRRDLRTHEALDALATCDAVFGTIDNDAARLILTELTAAYEIPLIDSAAELWRDTQGVLQFGGRVFVAIPGQRCLVCSRELDPEEAKILLESDETRRVRDAHGYGLGLTEPAPAVVSVNGVIAHAAVTEFLCMVTGLRAALPYLHYLGRDGKMKPRALATEPGDCVICSTVRGTRERAGLDRYALPGS